MKDTEEEAKDLSLCFKIEGGAVRLGVEYPLKDDPWHLFNDV